MYIIKCCHPTFKTYYSYLLFANAILLDNAICHISVYGSTCTLVGRPSCELAQLFLNHLFSSVFVFCTCTRINRLVLYCALYCVILMRHVTAYVILYITFGVILCENILDLVISKQILYLLGITNVMNKRYIHINP